MIRNINKDLSAEDEVCIQLHDLAFRDGRISDMRRPRGIMLCYLLIIYKLLPINFYYILTSYIALQCVCTLPKYVYLYIYFL